LSASLLEKADTTTTLSIHHVISTCSWCSSLVQATSRRGDSTPHVCPRLHPRPWHMHSMQDNARYNPPGATTNGHYRKTTSRNTSAPRRHPKVRGKLKKLQGGTTTGTWKRVGPRRCGLRTSLDSSSSVLLFARVSRNHGLSDMYYWISRPLSCLLLFAAWYSFLDVQF
jgi:hypothetical protein